MRCSSGGPTTRTPSFNTPSFSPRSAPTPSHMLRLHISRSAATLAPNSDIIPWTAREGPGSISRKHREFSLRSILRRFPRQTRSRSLYNSLGIPIGTVLVGRQGFGNQAVFLAPKNLCAYQLWPGCGYCVEGVVAVVVASRCRGGGRSSGCDPGPEPPPQPPPQPPAQPPPQLCAATSTICWGGGGCGGSTGRSAPARKTAGGKLPGVGANQNRPPQRLWGLLNYSPAAPNPELDLRSCRALFLGA